MITEGFSAVPVVNSWKRYKGWLSLMDIVRCVTTLLRNHPSAEFVDFGESSREFNRLLVSDAIDKKIGRTDPPPFLGSSTTMAAIEALALTHAHHVVTIDSFKNQEIIGILTQSMLISELTGHMQGVEQSLKTKTVREMLGNFESRPLHKIYTDMTALQAFTLMATQDVSSLPIVDELNDNIVDVLSVRDIRVINADASDLGTLYMDVIKFKALAKEKFPNLYPKSRFKWHSVPTSAVCVTMDDKFEDVVNKMLDGHIHQLYVTKQSSDPGKGGYLMAVAVISQSDIIREVFNHYTYASKEERKFVL